MERDKYTELALKLGADDAVVFSIGDIAFDSRTILKCMYGCSDWGKNHTCPSRPHSPMPWEYKPIFEQYKWGVIIHSHDKHKSQEVSYEIERQAFIDGYYFAFSLSDCGLCSECTGFKDKPCAFQKKARPSFHSVGIDVFKTVHKFGLPLKTLKEEGEEQNWYSAVFIE